MKLVNLTSSGPYGPLLVRSGYQGQDPSFFNKQMVTRIQLRETLSWVYWLGLVQRVTKSQFYASLDGFVQQEMLLSGWKQFYASLDRYAQCKKTL